MSTNSNQKELVIALSAIVQSCYLVDELSKTGKLETEFYFPLINSLFEFNPQSTRAIYGNIGNLRPGLTVLIELLSGPTTAGHNDTLRYIMSVLHLQKKLSKNSQMLDVIRSRLEHASFRSTHFSSSPEDSAASIAAVYQDTISKLNFRVQVTGHATHLQNPLVAEKIRALLFAAVRSGILWEQLGGKRWQLLLQRKSLRSTAESLLAEH